MPHPDAERWNARYTAEGDDWLAHRPHELLQDFAGFLPRSGIALDAASGVSADGFFLAGRGLRVLAVDISEIALRLAKQRARSASLPLDAAVIDLGTAWFPPGYFDVIANFNFLERATFPLYRRSLKPGGLLFFQTFLKSGLETPKPGYYLERGELLRAFQGFDVIYWDERAVAHSRPKAGRWVAQLVARKPGAASFQASN